MGGFTPGGFAPDILVQFLGGVLQSLINFVNLMVQVINQIGQFLVNVASFLLDGFKAIGRFAAYIWQHGISRLFTSIGSLIQKAHQFLESKLAPVIKFLKRVRAYVDRYYKLYLKPYLNTIQKLRRYLAVLKLLHIKFAQQLDARLAKTESLITRIFLDVRSSLNMLLNTVEGLTDPRRMARWVLASVAGRRVAAATVRAVTGLPLGHFAPSNAADRFAWERRPVTKHDYTDPRFNPPPSVIMAGLLTGGGVDGTIDPDPPDDAALDASQPLDYFGDTLQALVAGEDYFDDLSTDDLSITETLEQQTGALYDAGGALRSFVESLA